MRKKHQFIAVSICLSALWLQACSDESVNDISPGACSAADNKCLDNNIAQICENETLYPKTCENGCENGACKDPGRCSAADNACKDEKMLSACDDASGMMKERECANGCAGNACASGACTDDDNKCIDDNTALICEKGALYREKCSGGCQNGVCRSISCGSVCKTDDFESFCLSDISAYAYCESEFGSNYGRVMYRKCENYQVCLTSADKKHAGCYYANDNICSENPYCNSNEGTIRSSCGQMSDGTYRYYGETIDYCPAAREKTESGEARCVSGIDGKKCSRSMMRKCRNRNLDNCGIVGGEAKCFSNTCQTVGSSCAYDAEYGKFVTKHCVKTDSGTITYYGNNAAVIKVEEICGPGCSADGKSCIKSTDDGKTCSADAVAFCDKNGGLPCALFDGSAVCHSDGDKCDPAKGDKTRRYCEGIGIAEDACSFSDDGKTLLWKRADTYSCNFGEKCDPLTAACTNNVCNDRFKNYCKITSNDTECATYEDVGYCSREDAGCSSATVGQTKEICAGETNSDGTAVLARYQCIKIDDASGATADKYVWAKLNIDSWNLKSCPFGCTANACIDAYADSGACSAEQSAYCARLNPEYKCTNAAYEFGMGNCYKESDGSRIWKDWNECRDGILYILREREIKKGDASGYATFVNIGRLCSLGCHFNGGCMEDNGSTAAIKCADKQNYREWDSDTETFGATVKSCSKYCHNDACVDNICGDGITDGWEQCDAGPFDDDESWENRWEKSRAAGCTPECLISVCGNGTIEAYEECDDGTKKGTDESSCSASCTTK